MTLHPDARQFLDVIAESGAPPLTSVTPDEARSRSAFFVDDPLRDEGLAYVAALESAGVPVTVARYDDQIHAFFWLVNVMETADRAVAEAGAAIRDAMAAASA